MIELIEDPARERRFIFKNLPVDEQLLNGEILRLEEKSGRLKPGDHALRLAEIDAFGPASRLTYLEELAGEVERKTIYIGDNCLFKQITKAQPKPVRELVPKPEPKPEPELTLPEPEPEGDEEPVLVDPDAIRAVVVQTLKELFLKDFTAYQMARLIGADDRATRTVLSTLADQRESTGVLESRVATGEGKSKTFYRFYPFTLVSGQPVALPADVRGFILNLLHKQGAQNQTAILCLARWFFKHLDDHVLREALKNLERRGKINVEPGPRNAKIYTFIS